MNYLVVVVFLIVCILISVFLIKESYSSKKGTKISIIVGVISGIITILSSLLSNKYIDKNEINEINDYILGNNNIIISNENNTEISINNLTDSFITFDDISCYVISKNYNDTKINNDKTEFIFYNHPENLTELNTLSFSFMLDRKYNLLSTSIYVRDNIETDNDHYTSIQIFADNNLIYSSENLYSSSLPLQINLDLKDIYILSFSISTNMIDENEEVVRTIIFSETNIQ